MLTVVLNDNNITPQSNLSFDEKIFTKNRILAIPESTDLNRSDCPATRHGEVLSLAVDIALGIIMFF